MRRVLISDEEDVDPVGLRQMGHLSHELVRIAIAIGALPELVLRAEGALVDTAAGGAENGNLRVLDEVERIV